MQKKTRDVKEEQVDRFIRQQMIEAADRYEQELNSDPALDGLKPSPQVFENIMAEIHKMEEEKKAETKRMAASGTESAAAAPGVDAADGNGVDVEALLSEEDRRALEIGRKHMRHRGRFRILRSVGIAAALMAVAFGVSMVSEANRIRLMDAFNVLVGKEGIVRLDNEEDRLQVSDNEKEAREQIREKLDIVPVDFMYRPKGMEFEGYSIDDEMGMGVIFYKYGDTVLTVHMLNEKRGSSQGVTHDGEVSGTILIRANVGEVIIQEIEEVDEKQYYVDFSYNISFYRVYGVLPKEEFVKIIQNIIIF